jgi:hypothetical protein
MGCATSDEHATAQETANALADQPDLAEPREASAMDKVPKDEWKECFAHRQAVGNLHRRVQEGK